MKRRKLLKYLTIGGAGSAMGGGAWVASSKPANAYYQGPLAHNFDGRIFFNPGGIPPKQFSDLLKWKLTETAAKWPERYESPFEGTKPAKRVDDLAITMIGHATLLVQISGLNFITDPVYSDRASPVSFAGPKRVANPGVVFEDLPPIDAVLLSHNHYDHMDMETLRRLVARDQPLIITPFGNDTILKDVMPHAKTTTGNWGDIAKINERVGVHFEPIHHWSARGARDRRMALWAGFVIEAPAGKVYFVGDTGFHDGINYKAAGEKHGGFRAAILPIGAYAPRWFMKAQHQDPFEAVEGHVLCKAQTSIAHHWGCFQLTNEPIEEPVELLKQALSDKGLAEDVFLALRAGEQWVAKTT